MTTTISRAAVLAILRTPQSWDTFPDMIRRVEALEGCGVRVKALEWLATERKAYEAVGFNRRYYIRCSFEGQWVWQAGYGTRWFDAASEEAAKAAAQADYEARILAALEPVAQPETAAIIKRLAALRETFCYASPGSDAEFTSLLLGFDTAAEVIQEYATEPTPGQFTTMCLAIEDVVTGRGFDVAIPEEVKAYLRNALMVGGWKGEQE